MKQIGCPYHWSLQRLKATHAKSTDYNWTSHLHFQPYSWPLTHTLHGGVGKCSLEPKEKKSGCLGGQIPYSTTDILQIFSQIIDPHTSHTPRSTKKAGNVRLWINSCLCIHSVWFATDTHSDAHLRYCELECTYRFLVGNNILIERAEWVKLRWLAI